VPSATAARLFEETLFALLGTPERAAFMAEQHAVERAIEAGGCGVAAIERDERAFAAPAHVVQGARGDLLAGARFAGDQHRCLGRRQTLDRVVDVLDRAAAAEHRTEAPQLTQRRAQRLHFLGQLVRSRDAREQTAQTRNVDRFQQIVPDAVPQALDRALDRRVAGHHDHRQRAPRRMRGQMLQQIEAAAVGQIQVD
jgi:hypothetical protein